MSEKVDPRVSAIADVMCNSFNDNYRFQLRDNSIGKCEDVVREYMEDPYRRSDRYTDIEERLVSRLIINGEYSCGRAHSYPWTKPASGSLYEVNMCKPQMIERCKGMTVSSYKHCANNVLDSDASQIGSRSSLNFELVYDGLTDLRKNGFYNGVGIKLGLFDMLNFWNRFDRDSLTLEIGGRGLLGPAKSKRPEGEPKDAASVSGSGFIGLKYERSLYGNNNGWGVVLETGANIGVGTHFAVAGRVGFKVLLGGTMAVTLGGKYLKTRVLEYDKYRPIDALGGFFSIGRYF